MLHGLYYSPRLNFAGQPRDRAKTVCKRKKKRKIHLALLLRNGTRHADIIFDNAMDATSKDKKSEMMRRS